MHDVSGVGCAPVSIFCCYTTSLCTPLSSSVQKANHSVRFWVIIGTKKIEANACKVSRKAERLCYNQASCYLSNTGESPVYFTAFMYIAYSPHNDKFNKRIFLLSFLNLRLVVGRHSFDIPDDMNQHGKVLFTLLTVTIYGTLNLPYHVVDHFTGFAWRQTAHLWPLFQFVLNRSLCVVQCFSVLQLILDFHSP
jgi:hypothetical protein